MTDLAIKYPRLLLTAILLFTPVNIVLRADWLQNPDSTFSTVDSAGTLLADSASVPAGDSIVPIYSIGFLGEHDHGDIIKKEMIQKYDYRYTGDIFKYTSAGFVFDMGWLGQPNEISLYGNGFQNVSYLMNGVNINSRITNSLDLYNLQSENIDSVEVFPLPKGFLFGTLNNPAAAAFYSKDTVSLVPQSRIRFYQAPDDETYIDASFSAYVMDKVNLSLDFTNSGISSRFDNSNYGGWRASAKLRYMPSSNINIVAGYSYIKTETELNGGSDAFSKEMINYDNLQETVLYPTASPTGQVFSSRYQKYGQHNLFLKVLGKFFPNTQTELTLYRLFNNTEFRQNERTQIEYIPVIIGDNKYTTAGVSLNQDFSISPVDIKILSSFEKTEYSTDLIGYKNISNFSLGGTASIFLFDNSFKPSVFAKYQNYDGNSFSGAGADINYNLLSQLRLYAGYSKFERQNDLLFSNPDKNVKAPISQNISTLEFGLKYDSDYLSAKASFFSTENDNDVFYTLDKSADTLLINEVSGYFLKETETTGLNLNLRLAVSNFLITSNASYYFNHEQDKLTIPEFTLFAGAYYVDTLFNSNLKLKAGFNFYANGSQHFFSYDFQRSLRVQYADYGNEIELIKNEVSAINYQLDLFVAGQFQDSAILYITFENILGLNYYIVPYFPKQPRSLRFGVSWEFLN